MSLPGNDKFRSFSLVNAEYTARMSAKDEAAQAASHSFAGQMGAHLDNTQPRPHDESMNAPTREEIDAKLQLIEERMDSRVRRIEDLVSSAIDSMKETRSAVGNLKTTVITTGIGAVVAIILGVAAFNATLLSNMLAAFESGKNTSAAQAAITTTQADIKKQSEETAALLRQLQQQTAPPPTQAVPK